MSNYLTGLAQLNPQVKRHNGGGTSLTLDENGTTNATMLYVNGVGQTPGIDFNVSGATLTTTSTLPAGTNIATTIQYFNTGVVNTVADDAIGLGQMASGTDGNLISYDASGNPAHVATGNDGQVLTSAGAGAAPAFETLATGGGWEFVSLTTASGAADFTYESMTTGYDYMINCQDLIPGSDAVQPKGLLGIAGPTYRTSGYHNTYVRNTSSTSVNGRYEATHFTFNSSSAGNTGTEEGGFSYEVLDPANAGSSTGWYYRAWSHLSDDTKSGGRGQGWYPTAEAQTCFKMLFASGTLSGKFRVYKRANA